MSKSKDVDQHAADDLVLFIENDGQLYEREFMPIAKNLLKKRTKGDYLPTRAADAFAYLVESGAKKYTREVNGGSPAWNVMFNPATRRAAAERMARKFERRADLGEYDHLEPHKSPAQLDHEIRAALATTPAKARRRR